MTFETQLFGMFDNLKRQIEGSPLNLGGINASGGGRGGPPAGFIAVLPQTRVAYDFTEGQSNFVPPSGVFPPSGASLVHNLNRIRHRIGTLESGGGASILIQEDDIDTGNASVLNFEGAGVSTVDEGAGKVTITVTVSGGGGSVSVKEDDSEVVATATALDFTHGLDVTDESGGEVRVDVDEAEVNHDILLNFLPDEHIGHSTIDLTAGVGLSGGGTIDNDRTFTLDLDELGIETSIASGDFIAMVDIDDSGSQKITFANFESTLSHDALADFLLTEHFTMLDEDAFGSDSNTQAATQQSIKAYITTQTIPALTQEEVEDYAGNLVANASGTHTGIDITYQDADGDIDFILDLNELTTETSIDSGDFVVMVDITDDGSGKITFANLEAALDHDALVNFTTVEHFTMLDEDTLSSNSDTQAATQQSIKAYVDTQILTTDTLAEVLAIGNITGAKDIDVSDGQQISFLVSGNADTILFDVGVAGAPTISWDEGSDAFKYTHAIESLVTTGTPPFIIASTTKVANLNVDQLDDQTGDYYLLDVQEDDVSADATTRILNFEGSGIASVVSEGGDKVTITISGGGGGDDWATVLAAGAISGATDPIISDGRDIQIDVTGDADTDIFTVNVTGTPILSWDESEDAFKLSHDLAFATAQALKTSTSSGNTLLFQAYDVDGTSYTTFATLTANNTPTFDLAAAVTIGGNVIAFGGGAFHDGFSDFEANEHLDWTSASVGVIHETNYVDNDNQLSTEEVQDIVGPFIADGSGTHTGIAITYQDGSNDVDFIVDHDAAINFLPDEHIDWTGASDNFSTSGSITANSINGIDYTPGSDIDTDIITVAVTGTPRIYWDETANEFVSTHIINDGGGGGGESLATTLGFGNTTGASDIDVSDGQQISFLVTGDADTIIFDVGVAGTPTLSWDESKHLFATNAGFVIDQGTEVDVLIELKNDAVTHGITNEAESNTFAQFLMSNQGAGGLWIRAFRDSGSNPEKALLLAAFLGEAAGTTKDSTSQGIIDFQAAIKNGADGTDVAADGNLITFTNWSSTVITIDGVGTIHHITTADVDLDLLSINVTGTPTLSWDETADKFKFNKDVDVPGGTLIYAGGAFHDGFSDFDSDEHLAHSSIDIIAGVGLSGGGTIDNDRTLTLDLDDLGIETGIASGDFIAMVDISDSGSQKITFADFEGDLTHNNLLGVVANEHIDWTAASDNFSTSGSITANSINGIDYTPGSDTDVDIITVAVTGTPTISWDETANEFVSTHTINDGGGGGGDPWSTVLTAGATSGSTDPIISSGQDIQIDVSGDADSNILTINVTGTPVFSWDESEDAFSFTHGLHLGTTINSQMTGIGITIDQGTNDSQILAFKSSDVGHSMTAIVEADTYAVFGKVSASSGGLEIIGYKDADGDEGEGVVIIGRTQDDATTTKDSTADYGIIRLQAQVWNGGTSITDVQDDGNLVTIDNNGLVKWIVDAEGTTHVVPTSDIDVDLLTVQVTGDPSFNWDESADAFEFTKGARIPKRVSSQTSSSTPTINTDHIDVHRITALSTTISSFTSNLTGSPDIWDMIAIEITDNGTSRGITWGSSFSNGTAALPTETTVSTTLYCLFYWDGSDWRCMVADEE